ncbi:ribonuclease H-like domain-containing protein [Tanacetum coccineum]
MHTTMEPVQVKTLKIQAGVQVSRPEELRRHLQLWKRFERHLGRIPLRFWSDCVLTVVYLINRLPSSVLNDKSPFELVYKRKPNLYHLRLYTRWILKWQTFCNQVDDQNWSEGNVQNMIPSPSHSSPTQINDEVQTPVLRRSDSQSTHPVISNYYVLNSNVKYGIEKYVNYSKLNSVNLCFATTLNKSVEPSCLSKALSDPNWVEAMNNEIEALNRNNT